jgi:hypothetical protein
MPWADRQINNSIAGALKRVQTKESMAGALKREVRRGSLSSYTFLRMGRFHTSWQPQPAASSQQPGSLIPMQTRNRTGDRQ